MAGSYTQAGPVTVTKPDGTVEVRPAYRPEELKAVRSKRRRKTADVAEEDEDA